VLAGLFGQGAVESDVKLSKSSNRPKSWWLLNLGYWAKAEIGSLGRTCVSEEKKILHNVGFDLKKGRILWLAEHIDIGEGRCNVVLEGGRILWLAEEIDIGVSRHNVARQRATNQRKFKETGIKFEGSRSSML